MWVSVRISKWVLNPLIGLLIAMGTQRPVLTYAAALLCLAGIVFYRGQDALCMLLFVMSFTHIFKRAPGTTSFFAMLTLLYVVWHFFKAISFDRAAGGFIVMAAYAAAVHCAHGMVQIAQLVKFAANFFFLYFALRNADAGHPKDLLLSYVLGVVFSSLLKATGAFPMIPLYTGEPVELFRFTGMHADPNYYGVNVILALCILVLLYHRRDVPPGQAALLAGLLVWFSAMTVSKSVFLMLALPCGMLLYVHRVQRRTGLMAVTIGALAVLAGLILAGEIGAFRAVLQRLALTADLGALTTGRTAKWLEYMAFLGGSLPSALFGMGIHAPWISTGVPHNTYIDLLYYLGAAGTVLWCGCIASTASIFKRPIRRNALNYSVLACLLAMWFFLSELLYFDQPLHIFLAIVVYNTSAVPSETEY